MPVGIPFLIFLDAVGAIVVFVMGSDDRLASLTRRSPSSWSELDGQLRRRIGLVPDLVESVKGYAGHEGAVGVFQLCPHVSFELDGRDERQVPKVSARS